MPPFRAVAATVLSAAVLWVGLGAAGSVVAYFGLVPSAVAGLLLPATLPSSLWFAGPPAVPAVPLLVGVAYAGVLALLLRVVQRREAGRAVVPAWFAVIVTGFVVTALVQTSIALPQMTTFSKSYAAAQVLQGLAPAGLWGVVWGWLPALIGARLARTPDPAAVRPARAAVPVVIVLVAGGALVILGSPPTHSTQPAATPMAVPSPAPTPMGWARITPTPTPVPANVCGTADVTTTLGQGDAATGHRVLPIRVTNTGGRACVLDGYPEVVFDDQGGNAMNPLVVTGGSFMTTDPGPKRIRLAPGDVAEADLGWNAQSAAGDPRAATVYVSVHPGADRVALPADLDITSSGSIALTAWHRADAVVPTG